MRRDFSEGTLAEVISEANEPASAPAPLAFGYFWEHVYVRDGTVVGEGFSRTLPTHLIERPGYTYRLVTLIEHHREDPWKPSPCKRH